MSDSDNYIELVLARHTYVPGPLVSLAAEHVASRVKAWAGGNLNRIAFTGSVPKLTAIAGTTDVDLFISLKADTPFTLKEIYENLFAMAASEGWSPRRQNASVGITYLGVDIDLVPGRLQQGYVYYHSLWKWKQDTWQQTAPELHVVKVKESGRIKEIRAMKIWRRNHNLAFPSFYLELTVIKALAAHSLSNLGTNFLHALSYIANELPTAVVEDPSNTNNIVSDDLSPAEKLRIAAQARASHDAPGWSNTLW